jgi:hypothetical protein
MGKLPADPFRRTCIPPDFSRAGRVALIEEVGRALVEGRQPSREAALFVGAALSAWLCEGGRCGALERDFLRVAAPHRSTLTPCRLWQRMRDTDGSSGRATSDEQADTMDSIDNDADSTS